MSAAQPTAVKATTLSMINKLKRHAAQKKQNLLQSSTASSNDLVTTASVIPSIDVIPAVSPLKPVNIVNPAIAALKTTPKRRASIIIAPKPAATKRQTDRLKRDDILKINSKTYRVDHEIGSGGSCVVYKAQEVNSNEKYVALKIVDLTNAETTKIFENEIEFLQKLQDSPYVIKMFDHQRVKNKMYVVMELGERNFKEQMKIFKEMGRLSPSTLRYLWSEMLTCVKVIHDLNIVHADLKPANFVLVNNVLKLIDFGIAAQIVSNEKTVYRKGVQGTLNYISPEAVSCRPDGDGYEIPLKSDVWSLGCILFALVYGEPPFAHIEKQQKKILAILHDPIKFPHKRIDPLLLDVLKRCLTRDLDRRSSVQELLAHPYVNNSQSF